MSTSSLNRAKDGLIVDLLKALANIANLRQEQTNEDIKNIRGFYDGQDLATQFITAIEIAEKALKEA